MSDLVLDSCSMAALVRGLIKKNPTDPITNGIQRRLRVIVDAQFAIVDEWKKTASAELVQVLVSRWTDQGAFRALPRKEKIPRDIKKSLQALKFTDTIDKLVLETALQTTDRDIVSEDSDFWDPTDTRAKGKGRAPVAAFLAEHGVQVSNLKAFLSRK